MQRAFGTLLVLEHQIQVASRGQDLLRSRHDAGHIVDVYSGLRRR